MSKSEDKGKFSSASGVTNRKKAATEKRRAITPVRAIRAKCLDCSGDSAAEVRACELTACPLYPFRLGKNPNRAGRELSEEQKAKCTAALARAREARQGITA